MTATASSVGLAWNANTEADLGGYKVYAGTSPGAYTQTFDVGHATTYTVSGLSAGNTYYFAVSAYDIYGNESAYSREVSTTIVSAAANTVDSAAAKTNESTADTSESTADTSDATADTSDATADTSESTADTTDAPANTSDTPDQSSWSYWWNLLFGT